MFIGYCFISQSLQIVRQLSGLRQELNGAPEIPQLALDADHDLITLSRLTQRAI